MPLIDLDHDVRPASGRLPRRRLRALVALAGGVLLLGLSGEPSGRPHPGRDDEALCRLSLPPGAVSSVEVTVIDPRSGEVLQIVHCRA
jgi:hypothetical protein